MPLPKNFSETRFLLVIAMVQFINVLDFIMVMPLGPDLAKGLGIPLQHMGYIGGSYTMAAALCGFVCSLFLDNFDRRRVILVTLLGLSFATILPAFVKSFEMLIFARVLAGLFGGPLTAASLSMLADVIPVARRGTATGKVMGAFSVAMVFGVPFGLELSRRFSWHAPFITLGTMAFICFVFAWKFLPKSVNEVSIDNLSVRIDKMKLTFQSKLAWSSWGFTSMAMIAGFIVIPNIAPHVQFNMHYPRENLWIIYMAGGVCSFFSTRLFGVLIDKSGATFASMLSFVIVTVAVLAGFVFYPYGVHPLFLTVGFMVGMTARNVAGQTLSSQVPLPAQRASFMSIQTAMTHGTSAIGAFIGSLILAQGPNMTLLHVERMAFLSIAVSALVPLLFWRTETLLKHRKTHAQTPEIALASPTAE